MNARLHLVIEMPDRFGYYENDIHAIETCLTLANFSFWTLLSIPIFIFLQSTLVDGMQIQIIYIDRNLINI